MDETANHGLPGVPASGRLAFRVLRNGAELGAHTIRFRPEGAVTRVEIAIDYLVKLGFITVFRYKMRAHESWVDGVLSAADAKTDDNGKAHFLRAAREGDALMVEGSGAPRYQAPAHALLCTHWNQAQLSAPVINPRDGSLMNFTVTPGGAGQVADSVGTLRAAQRYALSGPGSVELWYGEDGIWTGLQAKGPDGSKISYVPLA
jgi:hypothetical protein